MKIALGSDFHTEMGAAPSPLLEERVDVAILAGDIGKGVQSIEWAHQTFGVLAQDIIVVLGNHDHWGGRYDKTLRTVRAWAERYPNVHFLESNAVEIAGMHFIGATAWTDYRYGGTNPSINMLNAEDKAFGMKDYRAIEWKTPTGHFRKLKPTDLMRINAETKSYIFKELGERGPENCVVVTHHAPTHLSIDEQHKGDPLNPCYVSDWGNDIAYLGPRVWVHGHIHSPSDYMAGDTRVLCNPIGYPVSDTIPERVSNTMKIIEL